MSGIIRPGGTTTGTPVDPTGPAGVLIDITELGPAPGPAPQILLWDDFGSGDEWGYSTPVSGPPSGPAGGDLSGSYPNPTVDQVGGVSAATIASTTTHPPLTNNPHAVTAAQVGAVPTSDVGAVNGVASLDGTGQVPLTELRTMGSATPTISS